MSPAYKCGIKSGDTLSAINGHKINDVLDYRFYSCEEKLRLELIRDGACFEILMKKPEYADPGLSFDTFLMDKKRSCRNSCIFCFIDQLPKGMRDTLYFKDDDSRLSFLQGNYVTLTNMSGEDIDRIVKMRMSPINISVHTMNPELRVRMLRNKKAGEVLGYMKALSDGGIEQNCQIVLCKGVNDGKELDYTMRELEALYPSVASVSVVPAGLTGHRDGLYPLEQYAPEEAAAVIKQVEAYASECFDRHGEYVFYCADELYVKAGLELPEGKYYGDYRQIENGVGMAASLADEFYTALETEDVADTSERVISVATGEAAYGIISRLCEALEKKHPYIKIQVYKIKNTYFGGGVTVAGLLTGTDIRAQLDGKALGEKLLLPRCALRSEGDLFLCGMSAAELSEKLGVEIGFCENDGYALFGHMTER